MSDNTTADPTPPPDARALTPADYNAAKRRMIADVARQQHRQRDAADLARVIAKHNPTKEPE